tara:strand:+ start:319 stop:618 length:300 start_codon:yes stop_codon:yes gene_type:complete
MQQEFDSPTGYQIFSIYTYIMDKVKTQFKRFWNWLKSLFQTRYKVTVSFNTQYGDSDDRTYVTKKVLVQKEKHLKFKDEHGKIIDYKSAIGLNYIIEEL